jgi:hypothetical protein
MYIPFKISLLATAVILSGCGGGGPGGSNSKSYIRSTVSYATPQEINTYTPLSGTGINAVVSNVFTKDLNNDDSEEVVVGGRLTQPATAATWRNTNIQIYGWNTGDFSNETGTWFAGNDNQIVGTEPSIKFGDFDGDGNIDMFSAPSTDMDDIYANAVVFRNSGSNNFTRSIIATTAGNSWTHDSWVGDLNGDGRDDIVMSNISGDHNIVINYGQADGSFDTHFGGSSGGSGISVADYLNDGSATMILTDADGSNDNQDTKLYSFTTIGGTVTLTEVATLPASRFALDKHTSARNRAGGSAHGIRNFSLDFNNDGLTDVIVIDNLSGNGVNMSEVQFLRNNGAGNFTDVTDDILIGYDTDIQASYNPTLIDINNDGLDDILLSAGDTLENGEVHNATRVLVQTSDGKFVQKYEDVFSDFYNQIYNSTTNALNWGQPISVVSGPNGEKFLFSTVLYTKNGNTEAHTYLAKIGTTGTITPQSVADVISATWPYLTGPEVNEVLANTSPLTFNGTKVVDLNSALQPVGGLEVNNVEIAGSISISGLNNSVLHRVTALDAIGRNYNVDLTPLANNFTASVNPVTQTRALGLTANGDNTTYSFGADTSSVSDSEWRFGISVGKQPYNPWINFDGMFGTINGTQTVEIDINREYTNGVWHRAGIMQYQTDFTPGLVTRVDDLWAGYAVLGYKEQGLNLYGGLKPTLFSGSVGLRLPTDVDSKGNLMYTDHTVSVRNRALGFLGIDYKFVLDITKALEYNVNAQIDSAGNKQGNFTAGLPW